MRLLVAAASIALLACVTEKPESRGGGASVQRAAAKAVAPCVVSGCSGQICAMEPMFSTCEWRPEFACFASATCAPQAGGGCGWVMNDELRQCLRAVGVDEKR